MARVAIGIEDVNQRGGQERVVCELIRRLAPRHEVDLYCYTADGVPEGAARVIRLTSPVSRSIFLRALWFIRATATRINTRDYDIILSQGANMRNQNFVLAHTCQALRRELVYTRHWVRDRPAWLTRAGQRVRWDTLVALERQTMARCRGRILAVDELRRRELIRHHGLAEDDVVLAENGVDHERFSPELQERWRDEVRGRLGLSNDCWTILFVGGLWEEKGLPVILEALAQMKDREARLVVVGSGDRARAEAQAGVLGVADRVLFTGPTPAPEQYYGAADCFAFLSLCEGLSLAQLEAAACGLPLVSLQGHAPGELVQEGVSGYLVPYEPGPVAERLDALAADRERSLKMGAASRASSLRYSWDRQAEIIEGAFAAYLEGR